MRAMLHRVFVMLADLTEPKKEGGFPLQNDPRFPIMYQENGCNVHVIAWHCWKKGCFELEDVFKVIYEATEFAIKEKVIDPDYFINDYDRLYAMFGLKVKYTQKHESPDRMCGPDEIEHLYWEAQRGKESLGHFTAGDGQSNNVFDPYGESYTRLHGEMVSKRIFKVLRVI